MTERFKASTQYGDMFGTVSLDGFEHAPLLELAQFCDVPKGFVPVGFSLFRLHPNKDGKLPFDIACVEGREYDQWREKSNNGSDNQTVAIRMFRGELPIDRLEGLFKRVSVRILHKGLKDANVVVQSG